MTLDKFYLMHLDAWLKNHVFEDDQDKTRSMILAVLEEHPNLLESKSWPELRNMAESWMLFRTG